MRPELGILADGAPALISGDPNHIQTQGGGGGDREASSWSMSVD